MPYVRAVPDAHVRPTRPAIDQLADPDRPVAGASDPGSRSAPLSTQGQSASTFAVVPPDIRLAQTARNNLFHGGKHGAEGWDDPERTAGLLTLGIAVLDQIAENTGLAADYTGCY